MPITDFPDFTTIATDEKFAALPADEQKGIADGYWDDYAAKNPDAADHATQQKKLATSLISMRAKAADAAPLQKRLLGRRMDDHIFNLAVGDGRARGELDDAGLEELQAQRGEATADFDTREANTFKLFTPEGQAEIKPRLDAMARNSIEGDVDGQLKPLGKLKDLLAHGDSNMGSWAPTPRVGPGPIDKAKALYANDRAALAKELLLDEADIDELVRHHAGTQKAAVSRDPLGRLSIKDETLFAGTGPTIKAIDESDLPKDMKREMIATLPERMEAFKLGTLNYVRTKQPELAQLLGIDKEGASREEELKTADEFGKLLNDSRTTQGASGIEAAGEATEAWLKHAIGLFTEKFTPGKVPYMEKQSRITAATSKARSAFNDISHQMNGAKTEIFGTDAATVGAGIYSGVESAAVMALTAGAGSVLMPASRIAAIGAKYGPAAKWAAAGVKTAADIAPMAAIYGVQQADQTYEQARKAGKSHEEAMGLAFKAGVIEGGITTLASFLHMGGTENALAALKNPKVRDEFVKSVRQSWASAGGKTVLGVGQEQVEENAIAFLNELGVNLEIDPKRTSNDLQKVLTDTATSTLFASGPLAAVSAVSGEANLFGGADKTQAPEASAETQGEQPPAAPSPAEESSTPPINEQDTQGQPGGEGVEASQVPLREVPVGQPASADAGVVGGGAGGTGGAEAQAEAAVTAPVADPAQESAAKLAEVKRVAEERAKVAATPEQQQAADDLGKAAEIAANVDATAAPAAAAALGEALQREAQKPVIPEVSAAKEAEPSKPAPSPAKESSEPATPKTDVSKAPEAAQAEAAAAEPAPRPAAEVAAAGGAGDGADAVAAPKPATEPAAAPATAAREAAETGAETKKPKKVSLPDASKVKITPAAERMFKARLQIASDTVAQLRSDYAGVGRLMEDSYSHGGVQEAAAFREWLYRNKDLSEGARKALKEWQPQQPAPPPTPAQRRRDVIAEKKQAAREMTAKMDAEQMAKDAKDRNKFPGKDYPVPPNVVAFQPRGLDTVPLTDKVLTYDYDGTAEGAAKVAAKAFTEVDSQFSNLSQRESVVIASGPDGMSKFRVELDHVHGKVKVTTLGKKGEATVSVTKELADTAPAPAPVATVTSAAPVTAAVAAADVKEQMLAPNNKRPAKEIKSDIIKQVEKEIESLTADLGQKVIDGKFGDVLEQQALSDRGNPLYVAFKIKGDGTFKIKRTSENLANLLSRVKRMDAAKRETTSTASGPKDVNAAADTAIGIYGDAENAAKTIRKQIAEMYPDGKSDEKEIARWERTADELESRAYIETDPKRQTTYHITQTRQRLASEGKAAEDSQHEKDKAERSNNALNALKQHPRYEELKSAIEDNWSKNQTGPLPKNGDFLNFDPSGRGAPEIRKMQDSIASDLGLKRTKRDSNRYARSRDTRQEFELSHYWKREEQPAESSAAPARGEPEAAPSPAEESSAAGTQGAVAAPGGLETVAQELRDKLKEESGGGDTVTLHSGAPNPFFRAAVRNDIKEGDLRSDSEEVEKRWRAAKLGKAGVFARVRKAAVELKNIFRRHFQHLDPAVDATEIDILRQHEAIPQAAKMEAVTILHGITSKLGPKKYDVFSRIVILPDILRTIDEGLYEGKDLPFGYTSREQVEADLAKFQRVADKFPDIKDAAVLRKRMIDALRDELVARDLLPKEVQDFDAYFHRQVLAAMALRDQHGVGTSSQDVRMHQKGFQKKRKGSSNDFNTDYLESEFEVVSQALSQIMTQDTLRKLDKSANIKESLKQVAKLANEEDGRDDLTWRDFIPDDYTTWQPEKGTAFYRASTVSEKALEDFLDGTRMLGEDDFREALVVSGPKNQWVIPKRLARTLDDFKPTRENALEKIAGAGISTWKVWTLLNPFRVIKYNVNNTSGDLDIVLAYNPKILREASQAATDMWKFQVKKELGTNEIKQLIEKGVINASFSVAEIPDIGKQAIFKALKGDAPNLIEKYWNGTKDFTTWREDVLRLAAYRHFVRELRTGKRLIGASRADEMKQMYEAIQKGNRTVEDAAAKLARELVGDYGNISVGGQWMRQHLLPFYSWMEINTPRYLRMFRNVRDDTGRSGAAAATWKTAASVGGATTKLALRAAILYGAVNLWNRLFFKDENDELNDQNGQMQLILGRNEDGSVRSLRIQGALSDALSWIGLENVSGDVSNISSGKKTIGDEAAKMALATPKKLINSASPIYKTGIEAMSGFALYPDPLNPRPIRDRIQHMAKLMSMGMIYDYLTDKPRKGVAADISSLAIYTTDVGEAAFYQTKALVYDYLKKAGKERPAALSTDKGNALYYYKQALKYGNEKQAERWKQRYFDMGGKEQGIETSIRSSAPLAGIGEDDMNKFKATLTEKEKAIIMRSETWYTKTYGEIKSSGKSGGSLDRDTEIVPKGLMSD